MFSDTTARLGDSDNNLLAKIIDRVGALAAPGDSNNDLLFKLLTALNGAASTGAGISQAAADVRYVLKSGDTMTGALNVGNVAGTDTFDVQLLTTGGPHFRRSTANANPASISFDKRGITGDATAAVTSGNNLGQILFDGWDGAAYGEAATIIGLAVETFSGTAHGGRITLSTTAAGTTTRTERVRVETSLDLRNGTVLASGGTQVVSTRKTGWTAATGTADRTTFNADIPSLTTVAQHLKALIDDLISHGLIGT